MGNGGCIGEVFCKRNILEQQIRVVSDIPTRDLDVMRNEIATALEVFRKTKDEEIPTPCSIAIRVSADDILS